MLAKNQVTILSSGMRRFTDEVNAKNEYSSLYCTVQAKRQAIKGPPI
jgi:hypothetical protein